MCMAWFLIPSTHRVFVTDRADHRIEIFDENGKFLGQWSTGKPSTPQFLYMAADRSVWIADGTTAKIIKFDLDGHYLYSWGSQAKRLLPGRFAMERFFVTA